MENWVIRSVVAVSPIGADCDAAYLLKVAYGDEEAEVVVEFTLLRRLLPVATRRRLCGGSSVMMSRRSASLLTATDRCGWSKVR